MMVSAMETDENTNARDNTMNAIQDYKNHWSASSGDLLASVCRNLPYGADEEMTDGDTWYGLYHFRRCSIIIRVDSQGFWSSSDEMTEEDATVEFERIINEIMTDEESALWESNPDRWLVGVPCHYPHVHDAEHTMPYPEDTSAEKDARHELARILRYVRRQGLNVRSIGDDCYEATDADDAVMVSDYAGVYSIEHEDNEGDRDRARDMW
jgi:hypothetical protein